MDEAQFVSALIGAPCDAAREAIIAQALGEHAAALEPFAQEVKSAWFDRYLNADLERAFAVADGLYQLGNMAQHAVVSALGLLARGDVERQSGHALTAMTLHQRAGDRFLGAGDRVGWARARGGWLIAASQAGKVTLADLTEMAAVRAIFADAGQSFRLAVLEQNIGLAYQNLGNLQEALDAFERGIALIDEQQHGNLAAMLIGNKANILLWQGDLSHAQKLHLEAYTLLVKFGSVNAAAIEEIYLSSIARLKWHHREALYLLNAAITTLQRTKSVFTLAFAYLYRADILLSLNRNEEALQDARSAVATTRSMEFPIDLALALRTLSLVCIRCGLTEEALSNLSESAELVLRAGYAQKSIAIELEKVGLLLRNGQAFQAKEAAFALLKVPLLQESEIYKSQALLLAVEATFVQGDLNQALSMILAFIKHYSHSESLDLLYRAYVLLGRIRKTSGNAVDALTAFETAIEHLSRHLHDLVLDQRAQFLEDKDEVYLEAMETALSCGKQNEAIAFLEESRRSNDSRHILLTSDVNQHIMDLRRRHRYVSESMLSMSSQSQVMLAAQQELKRLTNELRDILEEYTLPAQAISTIDRQLFPANAPIVLMYALLEEDLIIFVARHGHIITERVSNSTQYLRKIARALRLGIDTLTERLATASPQNLAAELMQWGASLRMNLGRLWSLLIQPVLQHLPPDGASLAIIPHSALHALPLSSLHDGERYLAERWLVHILPSSQAFSATESTSTDTIVNMLAIGYSSGEMLPQATVEAQHIAALMKGAAWVDSDAQGERLLRNDTTISHLHIAAHGALRFDVPNASFVQLADGPFHPTDVVEMDLRGCRLVTLSACETGLGRMSGGDEQIGLVRAFGFAGAEAVLATLWRVDDASTFAFMTSFYSQIAAGAAPATALQWAQRYFISGAAGPLRHHPYFWAGFQLTTNVWRTETETQPDEADMTQRTPPT
jgi:CHAT domain-containing protein